MCGWVVVGRWGPPQLLQFIYKATDSFPHNSSCSSWSPSLYNLQLLFTIAHQRYYRHAAHHHMAFVFWGILSCPKPEQHVRLTRLLLIRRPQPQESQTVPVPLNIALRGASGTFASTVAGAHGLSRRLLLLAWNMNIYSSWTYTHLLEHYSPATIIYRTVVAARVTKGRRPSAGAAGDKIQMRDSCCMQESQ